MGDNLGDHLDICVPSGPQRAGEPVYRPVIPRGPLVIANQARQFGLTTQVVDGYSLPRALDRYIDSLAHCRPRAVGISIHGAPSLKPALDLAQRIRSVYPSLPLLFGGTLLRSIPDQIVPYLPTNSVAANSLSSDVLDALDQGGLGSPPIKVETAGDFPWLVPCLDALTPELEVYVNHPDFEYHLPTQLGCPYRCFHCGTGWPGHYRRVTYRPIEGLREELEEVGHRVLRMRSEPPPIWITDETFTSSAEHVEAVCNELLALPFRVTWRAQTRADSVDMTTLRLMRDAGCVRLAIGVEIPTDVGLQLLNKRENLEAVRAAFALCRTLGIESEAILVLSSPGDDTPLSTVLSTIGSLEPSSIQTYIYHPSPGSPWWRRHIAAVGSEAQLPLHWWDGLDFHSPPTGAAPNTAWVAVARFLALESWWPGRQGSGQEVQEPHGIGECVDCGRQFVDDWGYSDGATHVYVRRTGDDVAVISCTAFGITMVDTLSENIYSAMTPVLKPRAWVITRCAVCVRNECSGADEHAKEAEVDLW